MAEAFSRFAVGDILVYLDRYYWRIDEKDVAFERRLLCKADHKARLTAAHSGSWICAAFQSSKNLFRTYGSSCSEKRACSISR